MAETAGDRSAASDRVVVLARRSTLEGTEAMLASAGFRPNEAAAPDELVRSWQRGGTIVRIVRDLATGSLFVIAPAGTDLPTGLEPMRRAEIVRLLSSPDPAERLAGLLGAEALEGGEWIAEATALLADPEPAVAERATGYLVQTLSRLTLGSLPELDPAAALFAVPGWRREKLQFMRWWMRDPPTQPARLEAALARALADPDWEIAVTAMLAAGRLGLPGLARSIRRLPLPESSRQGVMRDEARLLLALRDACLERLGAPRGKALPPGVRDVLDGTPDLLPHGLRDFAAALSLPLPVGTPAPETEGILHTAAGPHLADGTLLCWVPPGTYRLGSLSQPRGAVANPPHQIRRERGFFIDAEPREAATIEEAREAADALGRDLRRPVSLSSSAQWEMAVRGADGRRFPWGMNPEARADLSPLGLAGFLHGPGEWLEVDPGAAPLRAGGAKSPIPAHHFAARGSEPHAYRLVVVV